MLRVEHAITFDGPKRGADYDRHVQGVRWMMSHWRPFDFTPEVDMTIGYQGPLWYMLAGVILRITRHERSIAALAVAGWVVRQLLLFLMVQDIARSRKWTALAVMTLNAFLPISVLTDGKVNPEGLHSCLFTLAAYLLWRVEREARRTPGISLRTAFSCGGAAGLAVITKATAGVVPLAATIVLAWMARRSLFRVGGRVTWRRLLKPALVASAGWCLAAGWWCVPNLVKYGHPFPHAYNLGKIEQQPFLDTPVLYRRPLGWALPFYWKPYLRAPIMRGADVPRTNLWAMVVSGTWSDLINRGFCRLKGCGEDRSFWDGWPVSGRCLRVLRLLVHIGLFLSVIVVLAILRLGWLGLRSGGQEGSLALPVLVILGFTFPALFAVTFPHDGAAVLNARYFLPIATPICACMGIALTGLEGPRWRRNLAQGAVLIAAIATAILVTYERWG